MTRSSFSRLWEQGIPQEGEDDCYKSKQGKSNGRIATFSLCGQSCFGMAFPKFLTKQLYRSDSVVVPSFVARRYTTRR